MSSSGNISIRGGGSERRHPAGRDGKCAARAPHPGKAAHMGWGKLCQLVGRDGSSQGIPVPQGTVIPRVFPSRSLLLLTLAVVLAVFAPGAALADDEQNLVDPTQRADNSFIYDTTIESLFDQSSLYDGRTVQVVGEVIGDRISAGGAGNTGGEGGYCWITLTVTDTEDKSSISVLMSDEQANQIDRYGKYGVTGTILQVRGTYHQACDDHEGVPDIHATNSAVMARGVDHPDRLELDDFLPGIVAVLVGGALMAVFYFARERMR